MIRIVFLVMALTIAVGCESVPMVEVGPLKVEAGVSMQETKVAATLNNGTAVSWVCGWSDWIQDRLPICPPEATP